MVANFGVRNILLRPLRQQLLVLPATLSRLAVSNSCGNGSLYKTAREGVNVVVGRKLKRRQLSLAVVVVIGDVQLGHFAMVNGATISSMVVLDSISGRTREPISKTHGQ
jgi:hypothetical protein